MKLKTIGERIRYYRKLKNLRQIDLAKMLNVQKSTVSMWESNASSPVVERVWSICQALDITPSILLGYQEDKVKEIKEEKDPKLSSDLNKLNVIYKTVSDPAKGLIMSHAESVKKYDNEMKDTNEEPDDEEEFNLLAAHGTEGMNEEELEEVYDIARGLKAQFRKKKAEMEND